MAIENKHKIWIAAIFSALIAVQVVGFLVVCAILIAFGAGALTGYLIH